MRIKKEYLVIKPNWLLLTNTFFIITIGLLITFSSSYTLSSSSHPFFKILSLVFLAIAVAVSFTQGHAVFNKSYIACIAVICLQTILLVTIFFLVTKILIIYPRKTANSSVIPFIIYIGILLYIIFCLFINKRWTDLICEKRQEIKNNGINIKNETTSTEKPIIYKRIFAKKMSITIFLFLLVFVSGAVLGRLQSIRPPQISPSGKFHLETEINRSKDDMRKYLCVKIIIKDTQSNIIQEIQTGASKNMTWTVQWKENDVICLDSSDIGIYEWQKQNDKWIQTEPYKDLE